MMSEIVHVIEDDAPLRRALAFLLETHGIETQAHATADAFLRAEPTSGGCAVTDVRMPGRSGVDLLRLLADRDPPWPVVVMTGHGDIALAVAAMKGGAVDFLEKPFTEDRLIGAVRMALALHHDRRVARDHEHAARASLSRLSPRERDVLAGVIAGKLNKQIAHELEISPRTVEIYRANLMTKTGAHNMAELMRIAVAAGL